MASESDSQLQQQVHLLFRPKIIVAGAGVAGLSFANALVRQWHTSPDSPPPSITIYDRDTSALPPGRQGYAIWLRSDAYSGGMQVLQRLELLDRLFDDSITGRLLREAADAGSGGAGSASERPAGRFKIWGPRWQEWLRLNQDTPPGLPAPHVCVRRILLWQRLADAALVAGVTIHWDTRCMGVERCGRNDSSKSSEGRRLRVQLQGGATDECDFLVAADGASGKLRASLRPHDPLLFAGAVCLGGVARFPGSNVPASLIRDWGFMMGGSGADGTSLFVAPMDERSVWWYVSVLKDEPVAVAETPEELEAVRHALAGMVKGFVEPVGQLMRATAAEDVMLLNAKDKRLFHHAEPGGAAALSEGQGVIGGTLKEAGVVFIGDSSHAISQFGGNGTNLALMDGWDLAECMCGGASFTEAVGHYDARAVLRAKQNWRHSKLAIAIAHAKGCRLALWKNLFMVVGWVVGR